MTGPDYPLLAIPGHDLFQIAQVAAFIADRLHRHKGAVDAHDRQGRRRAARDVHAGRVAFAKLTANPDAAGSAVPRPLDQATYAMAERLAARGETRTVLVVSLAPLGRSTWAVIGQAPGIGQLGAEVPGREIAEAVAQQMRTASRDDLLPWLVSEEPLGLGTDRWGTADEEAAIDSLDTKVDRELAIAQALSGTATTPAAEAVAAASTAVSGPSSSLASSIRPAPAPAASTRSDAVTPDSRIER